MWTLRKLSDDLLFLQSLNNQNNYNQTCPYQQNQAAYNGTGASGQQRWGTCFIPRFGPIPCWINDEVDQDGVRTAQLAPNAGQRYPVANDNYGNAGASGPQAPDESGGCYRTLTCKKEQEQQR